MTFKHLGKITLTALATVVLTANAFAQATLNYNEGDLMMGFRATGGTGATQDYLVNIGPASSYTGGGSFALSIGNTGADLTALYGSSWSTRTDVMWSISGTPGNLTSTPSDPARTLFASAPHGALGEPATPWNRQSGSAQGGTANKMGAMAIAFESTEGSANMSTANSDFALIQTVSSVNSYASFMPGGVNSNPTTAFSTFNPGIEGSLGSPGGSSLDLFRMLSGSAGPPGTRTGTFSLNSLGAVTFVPVPEPGSAFLTAAAAGLLLLKRSRRRPVTA